MGVFWFSITKFRGKVLCTFRSANKTKQEKLILLKSKHVLFNGGWYNVNPKRVTTFWYNKGIHQFFPIPIPTLDFRFDSPEALDPETFQNTWDTPEAREMAGSEDDYRAFNKGIQAQLGKISRFPEWLFPAITIGAVLIIGYLVYTQGQHLSYLEQLIKLGQQ
tara:strand:+ start:3890 stop:4378 length:489 start_codon:yes stop_codon:yes gene_type:complete